MKKEVSIAVPIAHSVPPKTLRSMLNVVNFAATHGIQIMDIGVTEGQMIDEARNSLAEGFLSTSTEWIFWMDADMIFPKETLVELFKVAEEKNSKMVTGVYYQRKGLNFPVLFSRGSETEHGLISGEESVRSKTNKYVGAFLFPHPNKKEPAKAHAAGFGCVLIHRSVFEMMDRPWFKFIQGVCSEDFYFFVEAAELGFDLWYTPVLDLGHISDAPVITKKDFLQKLPQSNLQIDTLKQERKDEIATKCAD